MPRRMKNIKSTVDNHRLVKIKIIVKGKTFDHVVPSNIEPSELQMTAFRLGNISILQLCKWTMFLRNEHGDEEILMSKPVLRNLFDNHISPIFVFTPDDPDMPYLPLVDPSKKQESQKKDSHKKNERNKSRDESIMNGEEEYVVTDSDSDEDDSYTIRQLVRQTYMSPRQQVKRQANKQYPLDTIKSKSVRATSSSVVAKAVPYRITRGRR